MRTHNHEVGRSRCFDPADRRIEPRAVGVGDVARADVGVEPARRRIVCPRDRKERDAPSLALDDRRSVCFGERPAGSSRW